MRSPYIRAFKNIVDSFSRSEKALFYIASAALVISVFLSLSRLNSAISVEVPARGGTLVEGILGSAPFINPLLATSDAEKDLVALVFSGLTKTDREGNLIGDLAKEYSVSEDGKEYTFQLRDDIYFHDGTPVTAEDVEFTVKKAQDPATKSPRRISWEGVDIAVTNKKEIVFRLKQPFAAFILNTTMGILPKHLWNTIENGQFSTSILNNNAVGSGPYKIRKIIRSTSGTESIELSSSKGYALGRPLLENIIIKFFPSEEELLEAYEKGLVDSFTSISPTSIGRIKSESAINTSTLPRIFGVFFNQNQNTLFVNKEIRQALSLATDREKIIKDVLLGFGTPVFAPVPERFLTASSTGNLKDAFSLEKAVELLEKAGWKAGENGIREKTIKKEKVKFKFSISTSDIPELRSAALILKEQWEKLGAEIELKVYKSGDLNQIAIRPRKYDALLFGEIVAHDLDLFAFWHSSERNDPGLNIALYTNSKVDKLLERSRTTTYKEKRDEELSDIVSEIKRDIPAIFLYAPQLIYVTPGDLAGLQLGEVTSGSDRFSGIHEWYRERDSVWKIFTKLNKFTN